MSSQTTCLKCNGVGSGECARCEGKGHRGGLFGLGAKECDTCSGTGKSTCDACGGTGRNAPASVPDHAGKKARGEFIDFNFSKRQFAKEELSQLLGEVESELGRLVATPEVDWWKDNMPGRSAGAWGVLRTTIETVLERLPGRIDVGSMPVEHGNAIQLTAVTNVARQTVLFRANGSPAGVYTYLYYR